MVDWQSVGRNALFWAVMGGIAGGLYGAWHGMLRNRTCPNCATTFLGLKGKPTFRHKLGGKYVCPSCRTEFKDPLKLGA
jgi:hypothetical protein